MLIHAAKVSRRGHKNGARAIRAEGWRIARDLAPGLPLRQGMTRTAMLLIAAAGLAGLSTPAGAQEALKSFSVGETSHLDRLPNPFISSLSVGDRGAATLRVEKSALRMVAVTQPARLALSTSVITGLPGRVSWNQTHTALAGAFVVTLLMDAGQTRDLARHGWSGFREANPLLGARPSVGQVNTYTAIAGLSVLGAAAALPPKVRPWLLGAAIAVQAFTVAGSVQNGLPIRF